MENTILFVYLCTRDKHELFSWIQEKLPSLAEVTSRTSTSAMTMRVIPEKGPITVFTSNWFHKSSELGADGNLEEEMDGVKMATCIKAKNPEAKVYLFSSELIEEHPMLDGIFFRNQKDGNPSDEVARFLTALETEHFIKL